MKQAAIAWSVSLLWTLVGPGARADGSAATRPASAPAERDAAAGPRVLRLHVRTREPKTDQVQERIETVDSSRLAVVIVDPWNFHWCMTACERVTAMAPRWNRALQCARAMGVPVLWAPSDAVGNYSGWPQRERALAVPLADVPDVRPMPPVQFTARSGRCMCGPGLPCVMNYGWDGICPDLVIDDNDLIASSTQEVYSLLKRRSVTHVIYMGLHTNMCLFGKPGALRYMHQAGLTCLLARDINDAFTRYDPDAGFTPDQGTRQTDDDLERAGVGTIHVVDEWRRAGMWDDCWIVETVRLTPWGRPLRPYLFEQSVRVALTAPWLSDVQIRYTLDGSPPGPDSPLYDKPIELTRTADIRAAAFGPGGRPAVSLVTDGRYVRLPSRPPQPDVYLDELAYQADPYASLGPVHAGFFWLPRPAQSHEGKPLRVRGRLYAHGLGIRAPAGVRYEVKPGYERFVALAGVADNMLDQNLGQTVAMHCSVVFRVFVDGNQAGESPVMRISQEPWRFDVPLPPGARVVSLCCLDAGSRSAYDLGNWVDAGFVLGDTPERAKIRAGRKTFGWSLMSVPGYWDFQRGGPWQDYDGVAWYRAYVKPPAAWAGKEAVLHVERVDNSHRTYFNGRLVGEGVLDKTDYCRARLAAADLRAGEYNLVAVRVEDVGGAGGFAGLPPVLYCGQEAIELKGEWEFRTGDDASWADWPAKSQPPTGARFQNVVPAATVPRK